MPVTASTHDNSLGSHLYLVNSGSDLSTDRIQTSLTRRQEGLREVEIGSRDYSSLLRRNILARDWQLSAARELLEQKDVFIVTATGSGKSLCYQLALIAFPGKSVLVIFPLISLMADQVNAHFTSKCLILVCLQQVED